MILATEIGVVDVAQEHGNLLVVPVPCLGLDFHAVGVERELSGLAATFHSVKIVREMVGQQGACPAEHAAILVVKEDNLPLATSDGDFCGSHGSEDYGVEIVPFGGREAHRHGGGGEECAGVGCAVVITDGHSSKSLLLDHIVRG